MTDTIISQGDIQKLWEVISSQSATQKNIGEALTKMAEAIQALAEDNNRLHQKLHDLGVDDD